MNYLAKYSLQKIIPRSYFMNDAIIQVVNSLEEKPLGERKKEVLTQSRRDRQDNKI